MRATTRLADGLLAAAVATGKILDPAATFLKLYTGPQRGLGEVAADFDFATPTPFAAQAVTTWGGVQHLTDGRSAIASPPLTFVPASSADAVSAFGWALGDALGMTHILYSADFPAPYNLTDEFHPLTCIIRIAMGENGLWEASIFING